MQVKLKTFGAVLILTLIVGIAAGAFAITRGPWAQTPALAQAPPAMLQAPVLPVQMPLSTGTFAKVAEVIKPAVININTVSRGVAGGRTPFEDFFGEALRALRHLRRARRGLPSGRRAGPYAVCRFRLLARCRRENAGATFVTTIRGCSGQARA